MENSNKKYGVTIVSRPKIKAPKELNLSGKEGEQIVKSETKLVLMRHQKTFKRLEDM